ncbi:unnamed protein product [Gadus morhua 'NCC']
MDSLPAVEKRPRRLVDCSASTAKYLLNTPGSEAEHSLPRITAAGPRADPAFCRGNRAGFTTLMPTLDLNQHQGGGKPPHRVFLGHEGLKDSSRPHEGSMFR